MPSDRLHIVMVFDWFFYYASSIANALADDADVLVVTRDRGDEFGRPGEDASAEKRRRLDGRIALEIVGGRQSDPRTRRDAMRVSRRVGEFQPDMVHEQAHYDWRLRTIARSARVPRVLTVHDVTSHVDAADVHNAVHNRVARSLRTEASGLIVHGEQQAELTRRQSWYRGAPIYVIPHGVLSQPAEPRPLPAMPTALFFGRVEYYKGLDVLVEAARLLPADLELRILVAGRGAEVDRCRELAAGDPRFEWRSGFVEDECLPDLFAESSFVVLPYRDGSQSGVVPLAFANRRAVVVTDVGALAEAVTDGVTGVVVDPEDPVALAAVMESLARDGAQLDRMSEAALAEVTTGPLSAGAIARAHLAVYADVVGRSR